MHRRFVLTFAMLVAVGAQAMAVEIPPEHHPWGRFKPGSWQRVRVTSETLGGGGSKSVQVTEITTRLVAVESDGVVLTLETKDGDETTREENVKFAWDGSQPNDTTREQFSVDEVDVEGKTYACQTQQLTTESYGITTVTKSWYCPDHAPYFLKRVVRVTGKSRETSSTFVNRLAVNRRVLDRDLTCWESETNTASPSSSIRTTTFSSLDVPGGVVYSESESRDKQQGVARRVRVELMAYEGEGVTR